MPAIPEGSIPSSDGLASLERLKKVETDGDLRLRTVRGKIIQDLALLNDENETQVQAARAQAEQAAATILDRATSEADEEAHRIVADERASLAQQPPVSPGDVTKIWNDVLNVLFGEFR